MKDDNPDVTRAKMVALLSLLDVLAGQAEMSSIAIDRVGTATGSRFAGKVRLKFSVFGEEARLLELATELTAREGPDALRQLLSAATNIPDKIRFAMDRIDAWTEVVRRLVSEAANLEPDRALPAGRLSLPPPRTR